MPVTLNFYLTRLERKLKLAAFLLMYCFASFLPCAALYSQEEGEEVIDVNEAAAICAIEAKLDGIVFPYFEFNETPFEACLDFLCEWSIKLDIKESDLKKKGVRIVSNAPESNERLITFARNDLPLGEMLQYVARLGGAMVRLEPDGVYLDPVKELPELFTKVYQFSSNFVENAAGEKSARLVLESAGIEFIKGTSAVFNSESFQLTVRTREREHAKIRAFLVAVEGEKVRQTGAEN